MSDYEEFQTLFARLGMPLYTLERVEEIDYQRGVPLNAKDSIVIGHMECTFVFDAHGTFLGLTSFESGWEARTREPLIKSSIETQG